MKHNNLKTLINILANDKAQLRRFIGDPDAWILAHSDALSAEEQEELRRVAADALSYLESYTSAALGSLSERRFVSDTPFERRHFLVRAASVLLAAPLAAAALIPTAGALGTRSSNMPFVSDTNCDDSGSGCIDNGCTNSMCHDELSCKDIDCTNTGGCSDEDICRDDECSNSSTVCNDTLCYDKGCDNDDTCKDEGACTDHEYCSNLMYCSDVECTDGICCNEVSCSDGRNCGDSDTCQDEGTCLVEH